MLRMAICGRFRPGTPSRVPPPPPPLAADPRPRTSHVGVRWPRMAVRGQRTTGDGSRSPIPRVEAHRTVGVVSMDGIRGPGPTVECGRAAEGGGWAGGRAVFATGTLRDNAGDG